MIEKNNLQMLINEADKNKNLRDLTLIGGFKTSQHIFVYAMFMIKTLFDNLEKDEKAYQEMTKEEQKNFNLSSVLSYSVIEYLYKKSCNPDWVFEVKDSKITQDMVIKILLATGLVIEEKVKIFSPPNKIDVLLDNPDYVFLSKFMKEKECPKTVTIRKIPNDIKWIVLAAIKFNNWIEVSGVVTFSAEETYKLGNPIHPGYKKIYEQGAIQGKNINR